ncbi:hypothetical protein HPP92_020030 [Vanilla planifolia]|uniref:Transmembrane protein n=1 Tax=Vanilla planifolia TaxID=51239 RepID=A0A835ULP0_VANPL|nr:hypothetical protein HPP92_020030 [Vanilla planifolia]
MEKNKQKKYRTRIRRSAPGVKKGMEGFHRVNKGGERLVLQLRLAHGPARLDCPLFVAVCTLPLLSFGFSHLFPLLFLMGPAI